MLSRQPWATQPTTYTGPSPLWPAPLVLVNGAARPVNQAAGTVFVPSTAPATLAPVLTAHGVMLPPFRGRARGSVPGHPPLVRYEAMLAVFRVNTLLDGTLVGAGQGGLGMRLRIESSRVQAYWTSNAGAKLDSTETLVAGGVYVVMAWTAGTAGSTWRMRLRRLDEPGGAVRDVTGTPTGSLTLALALNQGFVGEAVNGTADTPDAALGMAALWRTGVAFTAWQADALLANPWQLFARERMVWRLPTGGGLGSAFADLAGAYSVRGAASADLPGEYAVRAAAARDLAGAYAVREAVSADSPGAYSVRGAVTADAAGAYSVRAAVSADLAGQYQVEGASGGQVYADLAGAYAVRAAVQQDVAGAYAVRAAVAADLPGAYAVLASVEVSLPGGYAVRAAVVATLAGAYQVNGVTVEITTPASRRFIIPAESRGVVVAAESRTYIIPALS